ncbi:hypothetical protein EVAR_23936_1 [Eumeta japonica]|uniref:Uncharacterized protein n=1 Tax=Eumeta variegata TaxID=151549 RepID=A0A4C1V2T5_EUMVA|nr:hypothetical protein EVAR_23936_1 [Eumeta japonica]
MRSKRAQSESSVKGVPVEIDTEDIKADLVSRAVSSLPALRPRGQTVTPTAVREMLGSTLTRNVVAPAIQKANLPAATATSRPLDVSHFPALNSGNKQTARTVPTKPTGSKNFHPAPAPKENQWKNPLPWVNPKTTGTENRVPQKQPTRQTGTAASALGEDIGTIMSILQVVRSAEVADLAAKFRKAKHGVDRLKIILENQELISKLENI